MKNVLRMTLLAGFAAMLMILGGQMLKAQNTAAPTDQSTVAPATQPAPGQPAPGARPGGGRGGRRQQFDPAQMQERIMTGIQERLGATDTEWTAIKPLVSDVFKAQQKSRAGMMGMFRGRGGRGGRGGGQGGPGGPGGMFGAPSPEAEALQTAADNDSTANGELKDKLKAYREAQKKDQEELKAAREKLRKVLTLRQEAKLVLMGLLD